jgi:hypothetical protein
MILADFCGLQIFDPTRNCTARYDSDRWIGVEDSPEADALASELNAALDNQRRMEAVYKNLSYTWNHPGA